MSVDDDLLRITHDALDDCTELQRTAYRLVYGINEDGEPTCERSAADVAVMLDVNPANLVHTLNAARAHVLGECCRHLRRIVQATEPVRYPVYLDEDGPGTATVDPTDVATGYSITTLGQPSPSRNRVVLGEGSEAMTRAAKRHTAGERRSATIDAHQRYTDGGHA